MNVKLPDFRNLLTTGNLLSAIAGVFIVGGAWASVQADIKANKEKIAAVDVDIKTLPQVKQDVAVIKSSQQRTESDISDIKHWLEKLTDKINK